MTPNREYWQRQGQRYRRRGDNGIFEVIARQELRTAARLYTEFCDAGQGWTLDLGSGAGSLWKFAARPQKLVSLDLVRPGIVSSYSDLYVIANAANPPFARSTFRTIVALGLLEYLAGLDAALGAWREIACSGARLLFSNSPPILPNLIRGWLGMHVIWRPDRLVERAAEAEGWRILPDLKRRSGWQTIYLAEAV